MWRMGGWKLPNQMQVYDNNKEKTLLCPSLSTSQKYHP